MAHLTLKGLAPPIWMANSSKGNPKSIEKRWEYFVIYEDADYGVQNRIVTELRQHRDGTYTIVPKSFLVKKKVKVTIPRKNRQTLKFGEMKLLDALDINYSPESVRVKKV